MLTWCPVWHLHCLRFCWHFCCRSNVNHVTSGLKKPPRWVESLALVIPCTHNYTYFLPSLLYQTGFFLGGVCFPDAFPCNQSEGVVFLFFFTLAFRNVPRLVKTVIPLVMVIYGLVVTSYFTVMSREEMLASEAIGVVRNFLKLYWLASIVVSLSLFKDTVFHKRWWKWSHFTILVWKIATRRCREFA